jgi:hypothetical protein
MAPFRAHEPRQRDRICRRASAHCAIGTATKRGSAINVYSQNTSKRMLAGPVTERCRFVADPATRVSWPVSATAMT